MKKIAYLRWYSRFAHRNTPDGSISDLFYSTFNKTYSVLVNLIDAIVIRYINRIHRLFVPKFYHDRSHSNFLKGFKYVGEKSAIDEKYFSETGEFGRKLHEYNKGSDTSKKRFQTNTIDWPFPEKYKPIDFTVHGFTFAFTKVEKIICDIINPKNNLINVENGLEEVPNGLNEELSSTPKKILRIKLPNITPYLFFIW